MSISTVQKVPLSGTPEAPSLLKKAANTSAGRSFASALTSASNQTGYSDDEVKAFFSGNPDQTQIAAEAASLGLNENQIVQAMQIGGYAGAGASDLKASVDGFVADPSSGYAWGADGTLVSSVSNSNQAGGASTANALPAASDIKAFYATNPTEKQITAKAQALGLTPAQLVQAEVTGEGMNMNQVTSPVLETMYIDAAKKLGVDIGAQGAWNSYFSPTLGRAVTSTEIQSFFATNPTQSQIFQKASDLGLGVSALSNMMNGQGISRSDGTYGTLFNKMQTSLYQGRDGFSTDQYGHIVAGGGNQWVASADGGGSWVPIAAGSAVNTTA